VLNQILEFHGIVQAQVGRLAALKDYMQLQRPDLMNDRPGNDDVDVYVGIVQRTFQVRQDASASLRYREHWADSRCSRRASVASARSCATQPTCCVCRAAAGSPTARSSTTCVPRPPL
jgi:hypothetical protein